MTKPKIIFGTKKKTTEILKKYFKDQKVNVSFIERLNLTNRQRNAKISRKTICYAKDIQSLKNQIILSRTYYNFCLHHETLKQKTPAMAEKITDYIWSFEKLLLFCP